MSISRRDLLKWGFGTAALCTTGARSLLAAEASKKKIPIGLQLYSVRHACAKDLPPVLEAVAKMGYAGVEFAGQLQVEVPLARAQVPVASGIPIARERIVGLRGHHIPLAIPLTLGVEKQVVGIRVTSGIVVAHPGVEAAIAAQNG